MAATIIQSAKKAAASRAVDFIDDNMIVGLGTGSTAKYAIEMIGKRVAAGLRIQCVPTSSETAELARKISIPLLKDFTEIAVTIDGADEVDEDGNLIKGGGGALTHEKIVAAATRKEIIIVDDSKLVKRLGRFPLPVEVLPFGWQSVAEQLKSFDCDVNLRATNGQAFLTDNQNYILDCKFESIADLNKLALEINAIPGVVENGLFVGLTDVVIVGREDGSVGEHLY